MELQGHPPITRDTIDSESETATFHVHLETMERVRSEFRAEKEGTSSRGKKFMRAAEEVPRTRSELT